MSKITKEILFCCQVASCIASDSFMLLERLFKKGRKHKYSPYKVYETILQSYLFCGFPAAIESMKIFKTFYPDFITKKSHYKITEFRKAGNENCKLIYKSNYKKLIENMESYSPDLKEWMIIEGYGKVMNRDHLNLREREYINFALLSTRFYKSQLHSHIKGCINSGANKKDLKKILSANKNLMNSKNFIKTRRLIDELL